MRDPAWQKMEAIFTSRTYQQMREFLLWRREALFQEEPTTTEALWKNRGAIEEVTKQLQGRELFLAYLKARDADQKSLDAVRAQNLERPPWLDQLESGEPV